MEPSEVVDIERESDEEKENGMKIRWKRWRRIRRQYLHFYDRESNIIKQPLCMFFSTVNRNRKKQTLTCSLFICQLLQHKTHYLLVL